MKMPATAHAEGQKIVNALGIPDPDGIQKLVLVVEAGDIIRVEITRIVDVKGAEGLSALLEKYVLAKEADDVNRTE
jgi:hypothetical protein